MTSTVDGFEFDFTDDALRDALAALGSTADEVAETLQLLHIHGTRRECSICPGANFLTQYVYPDASDVQVGEAASDFVRVDRWVVQIDYGYTQHLHQRVEAALPAPFLAFIEAFDDESANHYPFLEA